MGLMKVLRGFALVDGIASLFGINQWESGNTKVLRAEDEKKLRLARLFLPINILSEHFFLGPLKSRLYSWKEISEILLQNGFAGDQAEAHKKTGELIKEGYINFYWASSGVAGVDIVPYHNDQGDTKYRFEANFCDDGL